jgi:hypothetical protein
VVSRFIIKSKISFDSNFNSSFHSNTLRPNNHNSTSMRFINSIFLCALAGITLATPLVISSQNVPAFNPSDIYIESVSYQGSGCHPNLGDTSVILSDDRRTMTVLFSNYAASAGAGIPITASRSNCLLNIKVHTPNNYRFSVSQTTFHGYQDMGKACAGYVQASYWFSTETNSVSSPIDVPNSADD